MLRGSSTYYYKTVYIHRLVAAESINAVRCPTGPG